MRPTFLYPLCAALLSAATPSSAASDVPSVGTWGFDWLKNPGHTRCQVMTSALTRQFRKCEVTDGSFGGDPVQARKCKVDSHSEFMVYDTRAACTRSLETEQANE